MITLTKKYRIWWEHYTLNVQDDHEKDWSGTMTKISDSGYIGAFESDVLQDVLDKIEEKQLNTIGNWVHYDQ